MKKVTFFTLAMFAASVATAQAPLSSLGSGISADNLDRGTDPGTDFYRFACGGWMDNHPLTAEYASYGAMTVMSETNMNRLHRLIEGLSRENQVSGSLEQKIGTFYALAMDSTRLNQDGGAPVRADLERIAALRSREEVMPLMMELLRKGAGMGYFSIYTEADAKDSKINLVQLVQGGLTLGEREYYLDNDDATVKVRKAFQDYVEKLFLLCGDDAVTARRKQQAVLDIETSLARKAYTNVQRRDPEANYHKIAFADLQRDYDGIDWTACLRHLGYPAVSAVNVAQPEPLKEAVRILLHEPLEKQQAYLAFHLIDAAASYLSDEFRAASFGFYGYVMSGSREDRPRWKRAVAAVEEVLGEAVGRMYVDKYFPASSKQRMQQLVGNLQVALGQRIEAQEWMSSDTKQKALEKLATFRIKVGYPDKWRNYSGLTIHADKSYWENKMAASAFAWDEQVRTHVNKPVDPDEWYMDPQTVNAYYNPATNEICFPAGILEPPFFDASADDAANYGAIGVVIGHEMTHGFDDQGRKYDKDGNMNEWWTEDDARRFKERSDVMVRFFDRIEVLPGLQANGRLTLGENLADHGGLKVAYQAFCNATGKKPLPVKDGFTPEQRFFLSYASIWAMNCRDEFIRLRTKNDVHALGRWRVNGALPHIQAWYDAFGITERSPLFIPVSERVTIW